MNLSEKTNNKLNGELQYLSHLSSLLEEGSFKGDRTGTGTYSIFGHQMRFNMEDGFPLLTTKKCHLKSIIHELIWFLNGETNIKYLKDNNVKIWDEWADENGDLGPIYGAQWRNWNNEGIDQILNLINEIKCNPDSRRHIVTGWNPSVLPDPYISPEKNSANGKQNLPPCHTLFQFYVNDGKISLLLYQRSADWFLGVPFNIASYSLLLLMVAQVCELEPFEFIHTFGDTHLYSNHIEQAKTQLSREPYKFPKMVLNKNVKSIDDFTFDDFELVDYVSHPSISAPIAK